MVYKSDLLNDIVNVDETNGIINFDCNSMNQKQKELFDNYKREIVRESVSITSGLVKMDDTLVKALNNNNVKLDTKKLNSRQAFLLDCCIKELERKIDPEIFKEHKQCLKRKRNNECASKFRKKRKDYEKINNIIHAHINDLVSQCKKSLDENDVELIKKFLNENNLQITLKYFNDENWTKNDYSNSVKGSSKDSISCSNSSSINSDCDSNYDSCSNNGTIESEKSIRLNVDKMYINKPELNNIKNEASNDDIIITQTQIQNNEMINKQNYINNYIAAAAAASASAAFTPHGYFQYPLPLQITNFQTATNERIYAPLILVPNVSNIPEIILMNSQKVV